MKRTRYNPERRAWKGHSYRKGRQFIRALRDAIARQKTPEERKTEKE